MKRITLIVIILVVIAIITIALIVYNNNSIPDDYIYKLTYNDNFDPGSKYEIFIYDYYNMKVSRTAYGSTLEYIQGKKKPKVTVENVNFSDRNKEIVKEFIEEIFEDKNIKEKNITSYDFTTKQKNILNAIIFNSEIFFEYIDEETSIGL